MFINIYSKFEPDLPLATVNIDYSQDINYPFNLEEYDHNKMKMKLVGKYSRLDVLFTEILVAYFGKNNFRPETFQLYF